MKKFLIALLCALSVNTVYADEPDDLFNKVDILAAEYFAGHVDLETAQELCKKVFQYAYAHNIEIWLEKEQGGFRLVDRHVCETDKYGEDATHAAVFFAWSAADKIKSTEIKPHASNEQAAMELAAQKNCIGSGEIHRLKYLGYEVQKWQSVVKCSQTDKRCLVSVPVHKDHQSLIYTACCMIDSEPGGAVEIRTVSRSDENGSYSETTYNGTIGAVSLMGDIITSGTPNLDDFDYACKYIK